MKKILIVDDDRKIAAALEIRLRASDYEVFTARDGDEGLKLAARHRPDLIVMDVWMPNGVGPLVAQRLKHIGLADVPVIFLTAGKRKDLWDIAQDVDPAGFFEKPYDPAELLQSIGNILARDDAIPAALHPAA
jgi:DNA-binding response OmpR family regulator